MEDKPPGEIFGSTQKMRVKNLRTMGGEAKHQVSVRPSRAHEADQGQVRADGEDLFLLKNTSVNHTVPWRKEAAGLTTQRVEDHVA